LLLQLALVVHILIMSQNLREYANNNHFSLGKYNRYAINRTIFFTFEWLWFRILESYAMIKQFMRSTGMQLN